MPRFSRTLTLTLTLAWLTASSCALVELTHPDASWPMLDGTLPVAGLEADATITRDAWGIPHIQAANEHDMWLATGFAIGQDRFFEADLFRHFLFGRVSEWMGKDTVDTDAFVRAIGLEAHARAMFEALDGASRAMLQAYTDGMNAGLASLPEAPLEYRVLGVEPEPWKPEDCFTALYMMSWTLAENPTYELAAWQLRDVADAAMLNKLFGWGASPVPVDPWWDQIRDLKSGPILPAFTDFLHQLGGKPHHDIGGNAWIVTGKRTASGLPILANDPQIPAAVPSIWVPIDADGQSLHITGASFPGLPGVIMGHNGKVAFGLTHLMADVVDLPIVKLTDDDGYIVGGETRKLKPLTLTIGVHGHKDETRTVWTTDLGPLITDRSGDYALALQWHATTLMDRTPWVIRALSLTNATSQVMLGLSQPMMVPQNLLVADIHGEVALQGIGTWPTRSGFTGRVPYPAFAKGFAWTGWESLLPGWRDDDDVGYLFSTNERPSRTSNADGRGEIDLNAVGGLWAPPYRADRLEQLLSGLEQTTPEAMTAIQTDKVDRFAQHLLPALLDGVRTSADAQPCADHLAQWDGVWREDSAGAAVWATTQRYLITHALEGAFKTEDIETYLQAASPSRNLMMVGDFAASLGADRTRIVARSLAEACEELRDTSGRKPEAWTWGDLHPLKIIHPFAREKPAILGRWNMPDVPFPGAGTTLSGAQYSFDEGLKTTESLPAFRLIMPLDDLGATTFSFAGGPSGHPRHPDAATGFDAFVSEESIPLYSKAEDIEAHKRDVLTLKATRR